MSRREVIFHGFFPLHKTSVIYWEVHHYPEQSHWTIEQIPARMCSMLERIAKGDALEYLRGIQYILNDMTVRFGVCNAGWNATYPRNPLLFVSLIRLNLQHVPSQLWNLIQGVH